jgi:hypothetical protein
MIKFALVQLTKAAEKEEESKKKIIAIDKELKRIREEKVCTYIRSCFVMPSLAIE